MGKLCPAHLYLRAVREERLPGVMGGDIRLRTQVQEFVLRAAVDFDAFYSGRFAEDPEETVDPLILILDGKGIVMRTEHSRAATRRAA